MIFSGIIISHRLSPSVRMHRTAEIINGAVTSLSCGLTILVVCTSMLVGIRALRVVNVVILRCRGAIMVWAAVVLLSLRVKYILERNPSKTQPTGARRVNLRVLRCPGIKAGREETVIDRKLAQKLDPFAQLLPQDLVVGIVNHRQPLIEPSNVDMNQSLGRKIQSRRKLVVDAVC
ncbi:hypothetical protein V8F20_005448 [Naviculisporaceae sp. PSN 640]